MQFDYARFWPYLIAVLTVLLVYRRLRRSFGRQRVRPVRMSVRIAVLLLLGCSVLPMSVASGQFLTAELAGLAVGVALGVWGARHTRYQNYDGHLHYVPHTYTGIAVSLLFVGRLAYRFVELYSMKRGEAASGADYMQGFGSPPMMRSPFTIALLFLVIGYYVCYYSLVLWKSKHISPEDLEVASTPSLAPP